MAKLIIFEDCLDSGLCIHGFQVMSEKGFSEFENLALSITWEFEFHLDEGEECIHYVDGEDFLNNLIVRDINAQEFNSLDKFFGGKFGMFPGIDYLENIIKIESKLDEEYNEYEPDVDN